MDFLRIMCDHVWEHCGIHTGKNEANKKKGQMYRMFDYISA